MPLLSVPPPPPPPRARVLPTPSALQCTSDVYALTVTSKFVACASSSGIVRYVCGAALADTPQIGKGIFRQSLRSW